MGSLNPPFVDIVETSNTENFSGGLFVPIVTCACNVDNDKKSIRNTKQVVVSLLRSISRIF